MIGATVQEAQMDTPGAAEIDIAVTAAGIVAPTVTNGVGANLITGTTARLNGEITDTGNDNPAVTVFYGLVDGDINPLNWTDNASLGLKPLGAFNYDVAGLVPDTMYFYRMYAENSAGNDWANSTANFTTGHAAWAPPVQGTDNATDVILWGGNVTLKLNLPGGISFGGKLTITGLIDFLRKLHEFLVVAGITLFAVLTKNTFGRCVTSLLLIVYGLKVAIPEATGATVWIMGVIIAMIGTSLLFEPTLEAFKKLKEKKL